MGKRTLRNSGREFPASFDLEEEAKRGCPAEPVLLSPLARKCAAEVALDEGDVSIESVSLEEPLMKEPVLSSPLARKCAVEVAVEDGFQLNPGPAEPILPLLSSPLARKCAVEVAMDEAGWKLNAEPDSPSEPLLRSPLAKKCALEVALEDQFQLNPPIIPAPVLRSPLARACEDLVRLEDNFKLRSPLAQHCAMEVAIEDDFQLNPTVEASDKATLIKALQGSSPPVSKGCKGSQNPKHQLSYNVPVEARSVPVMNKPPKMVSPRGI